MASVTFRWRCAGAASANFAFPPTNFLIGLAHPPIFDGDKKLT